ncbi:unnamed protein product, partial [Mesorhabditis belari]|uniref:snRNA-activating protein complex subunit 4 n=1 Tax=Mesorhabditis belari TaxID=2138241 RepID=A0AAF3EUF8_9BILA
MMDQEQLDHHFDDEDLPGTSQSATTSASLSILSAPPIIVREAALEVIDKLVAKVDHELCCVNQRLRNLEADSYREENKSLLSQAKIPVSQFLPPYFRNDRGYGPPPNEETIMKRNNFSFDPLVKVPRPWISREINFLKAAVREEMIEMQLSDYRLQIERLNEKINASGVETSKEERAGWMAQKDKMLGIIEYVKTNGPTLPPNPMKINWSKIAAKTFKYSRNPIEIRLKWINDLDPAVNNGKWSPEEISSLHRLTLGKHGFINWSLVAQQLGTGRRPFTVFQKYQEDIASKMPREWTREEDEKLLGIIEMVRCGDKVPWEKVSQFMIGRTIQQVKMRAKSLDPATKYGRWTEDEDLLLLCAIEKFGTHAWDKVKQTVPGRTESQCKQRWRNQLSLAHTPGAQVNTWTLEEDEKLLAGVNIFGKGRWRAISDTMLPERQIPKIRARYLSLVTTKLRLISAQADMVRSAQQALNVRAITQMEKKNRLFDRFNDLTGQNNEIIESIRKQGENDMEERKKKFAIYTTEDERHHAEMKKKEIEEFYKKEGELSEAVSSDAAQRLLEGIVIDEQDLVDLADRSEKRRRVYNGRPSAPAASRNPFEIDPKTMHVRTAKKLRTPVRVPNFESKINVDDEDLAPEETRDVLTNAIAQRIRLNDDYFFQNLLANADQLKAAMKSSFQAVLEKVFQGDHNDLVPLPPNMATLALQQKLTENRYKMLKSASLYFETEKTLDGTPVAENRAHIQLSKQITASDEFKQFKNRMRALLFEPMLLDTALWSTKKEEEWIEMKSKKNETNGDGEIDGQGEKEQENGQNDDSSDLVTSQPSTSCEDLLAERPKQMNPFDIEKEASLHRHKIDQMLNDMLEIDDDDSRIFSSSRHSNASLTSKDNLMTTLNSFLMPQVHQAQQDVRIPPPAPNPLSRPPAAKKKRFA